ncbi:MAG: nucleoside hydrolase [Chloroflexaceae bacterium]|nr:nucleoside hydrolase [Chloroflexaceae bacterium]NJO05224.1 nucleoside hydrolase [Chloroflexaceae bacterium]
MPQHRIIIDTDPGIDDALTFLLALAAPAEIDLIALTTVGGNCTLEQATRNALDVLALAQASHIPVAVGCALPLMRPLLTAAETHGSTGLGNAVLPASPVPPIAEHAVDLLIREILAAPGAVTVVAIGPLTNLALAIRKAPRIVQAVKQVIMMGGALRVDGNVTPLAEFNVYVDPHAAHIVLHSGMPITLLPWDITRAILLTQQDVETLLQVAGPIPRFVADTTRPYIAFHAAYFNFAGCSVNDPAALALAFMPDLATLESVYVDVEYTSALTMGKTVADFAHTTGHAPNVQAVVGFDTPRFMAMLLERFAWLARRVVEQGG